MTPPVSPAADPDVLAACPELSTDALRALLAGLVRIPSVNPDVGEARIAGHVRDLLEETTAAEVQLVETLPGRPSVGAVVGSGSGPALVLNGHLDTVPVGEADAWSVDPFGAETIDGRLFGRGACDMKAGLAVQIAVAQLLSRAGSLRGRLVLHFAVGEEHAEPGTHSLLDAGFVGDVGITGEPTELCVGVASRGLVHIRVRLAGRSGHASRPDLTLNPVASLAAALSEVAAYGRELHDRAHPLLPPPSCTPTMVSAGVKENSVPDSCVLVLDRRLLPGERIAAELEALERRLRAVVEDGVDVELSQVTAGFEPAEIDSGSPFALQLAAAVDAVGAGVPPSVVGLPYASDVSRLVLDAGIEAVTFGAGSVAQCHCADEWIALDDVRHAALAVALVACDLLL